MADRTTLLRDKLRTACYLLLAGLLVQAATLVWNHPTSFLAFLGVGGILTLAGIVTYLRAIVSV